MTSPPLPPRRRWLAVAVLCIRLVVIALDATIVNVAVPTIASKLHASEDQLQWIVDGYTLTFSVLLLTFGHMADTYGRQLVLILGLILFRTGFIMTLFAI